MNFDWLNIAIFVALWNVCVFFIKWKYEIRSEKRKAALNFLTKVNINIHRVRDNYICDMDRENNSTDDKFDVCVSSYTAYRMTLKGDTACRFDKCWQQYITELSNKNECLECLFCLKDIVEEELNCGHTSGIIPSTDYVASMPKCNSCSKNAKLIAGSRIKKDSLGNIGNQE